MAVTCGGTRMSKWNDIVASGSGVYALHQADEPRIHVNRSGECFWQIDGTKCAAKDSLFAEFARELVFPDYFGNNWDAFDECISSLDWLPCTSHFILIRHATSLLSLGQDLKVLLKVLQGTSKEWAEAYPNESFKVVLLLPENGTTKLLEALQQAGLSVQEDRGQGTP